MNCWKCGTVLSDYSNNKLPFRAECDKCHAALHSCHGCKYYKPGLPNDCMVPNTEWISDREVNNFCEEFSPVDHQLKAKKPSSKGFNDLFK